MKILILGYKGYNMITLHTYSYMTIIYYITAILYYIILYYTILYYILYYITLYTIL